VAEKTKLTVRVDERWLEEAKEYAARHNTSLSRLISEFLHILSADQRDARKTPVLKRLTGILPADVSAEEYHEHLAEKYQG